MLKHREVKRLASGHSADKKRSWNTNPTVKPMTTRICASGRRGKAVPEGLSPRDGVGVGGGWARWEDRNRRRD